MTNRGIQTQMNVDGSWTSRHHGLVLAKMTGIVTNTAAKDGKLERSIRSTMKRIIKTICSWLETNKLIKIRLGRNCALAVYTRAKRSLKFRKFELRNIFMRFSTFAYKQTKPIMGPPRPLSAVSLSLPLSLFVLFIHQPIWTTSGKACWLSRTWRSCIRILTPKYPTMFGYML